MKDKIELSGDELLSKTISFLRFPLIVGVLFIHSYFSGDFVMGGERYISITTSNYPFFSQISYLLSNRILSCLAVPLFFVFSGFLFFAKIEGFDRTIYLQKLSKRIRSLLVPFLFWNLLTLLFFFLAQTFMSSFLSGKNMLLRDYNIIDWLWAFWDASRIGIGLPGFPIDYPLWFIRDLMVVICISPLIYFLIKKLHYFVLIVLSVLWISGYSFHIYGLSMLSIYFFSVGAYFSIYRKNIIEVLKPFFPSSIYLYLLFVAIEIFFYPEYKNWMLYLHNVGMLFGLIAVITTTAHFVSRGTWRDNKLLDNSSFFVYAYHALPLAASIKILFLILRPHSESSLLLIYFASPLITILIGLFFYALFRKYLPSFTTIITGGRK
jgi:peptidoglycan/LPS O-acetylase OafA/YrhL